MIPDRDLPKIHSPWYEWSDQYGRYRLRVEYGWSKHGDQEPYFAIGGTQQGFISAGESNRGRWSTVSVGCLHDTIVDQAPDLAVLIPFHLMYLNTGPMHYFDNAMYAWHQIVGKVETRPSSNPAKAFASTICWGALPDDEECGQGAESIAATMRTVYEAVGNDEATDWIKKFLDQRKPKLLDRFHEVMRQHGLLSDIGIVTPERKCEEPPIKKFAQENKIRFTAEYDNNGTFPGWGDGAQHYKCIIRCGSKSMRTHFAMGSAHTLGPTIDEVLSSMLNDIDSVDNAGDFESWMSDMGFSDDPKLAKKWYDSIVRSEEGLRRVLGDDLFETLRNEVDRQD